MRCEIYIHVARGLIVADILERVRSDAVVLVTQRSISVAWFSGYKTLIWYHWTELSICVIYMLHSRDSHTRVSRNSMIEQRGHLLTYIT